jgi:hypothetical protein
MDQNQIEQLNEIKHSEPLEIIKWAPHMYTTLSPKIWYEILPSHTPRIN